MSPDDTEMAEPVSMKPTRNVGLLVGFYPFDWRLYFQWGESSLAYARLHIGPLYLVVEK